jgi:protein-S-isoprenylcysteine O-methyltransferase Ste14
MRIPPPLLFATAFFIGVGLQHIIPLTIHSPSTAEAGNIVGVALLTFGLVLALSCVRMFLTARTTIIPHGTASKLLTAGPYRFTRNPMYVSLVLIYVGVAGILIQVWPLLVLPLPIAIVNSIVIPFEETRLRETFGDAFEQYCAGVRRWL